MSRLNLGVSLLGIVGLVGLVGAMAPSAMAAGGTPGGKAGHRNVAFGTVSNLGSSSFDLSTSSGTVTVTFDTSTKFRGVTDADNTAGIADGDSAVAGIKPKTQVAGRVRFGASAFPIRRSRHPVRGLYSSNTDTTVTITGKKNTSSLTFNVIGKTKYVEDGQQVTTPTYAAGDRVRAGLVMFSDGSVVAARVGIHSPKSSTT